MEVKGQRASKSITVSVVAIQQDKILASPGNYGQKPEDRTKGSLRVRQRLAVVDYLRKLLWKGGKKKVWNGDRDLECRERKIF